MGNYTTFLMFENPRRGRQARNSTENDPKILDLKSSSEHIIFRKLSLGAPDMLLHAKKQANTYTNTIKEWERLRKNVIRRMQRLQVLQLIITHHLRGRTADWIET